MVFSLPIWKEYVVFLYSFIDGFILTIGGCLLGPGKHRPISLASKASQTVPLLTLTRHGSLLFHDYALIKGSIPFHSVIQTISYILILSYFITVLW